MTSDRYAQIRRRLEAATSGPWSQGRTVVGKRNEYGFERHIVETCWPDDPRGDADMELIAHASADLAFLLGEVAAREADFDAAIKRGDHYKERAEKAERERDEARARIAQLEREMAGEQEGRSKLLRAYEARDGEVAALLAVCSQEQIDQAIRRVQSPHPTR